MFAALPSQYLLEEAEESLTGARDLAVRVEFGLDAFCMDEALLEEDAVELATILQQVKRKLRCYSVQYNWFRLAAVIWKRTLTRTLIRYARLAAVDGCPEVLEPYVVKYRGGADRRLSKTRINFLANPPANAITEAVDKEEQYRKKLIRRRLRQAQRKEVKELSLGR